LHPNRKAGAQKHHGYRAGDVTVKNIRAHARHVTHVVANIIRDHSRIAGVVLRDAKFNFAHQVRGDIRGLCVNATARFGQQRQGAGAKAKPEHGVRLSREDEDQAHPNHSQTDHCQAQHRTGIKGKPESLLQALLRGGRGTHVSLHSYAHAHVPRYC